MSRWPVVRARRVLAALLRIGWRVKRQAGSHRTLAREGWPDVVFAFDEEEIGPGMLARIARRTGLEPDDLQGADAPVHPKTTRRPFTPPCVGPEAAGT